MPLPPPPSPQAAGAALVVPKLKELFWFWEAAGAAPKLKSNDDVAEGGWESPPPPPPPVANGLLKALPALLLPPPLKANEVLTVGGAGVGAEKELLPPNMVVPDWLASMALLPPPKMLLDDGVGAPKAGVAEEKLKMDPPVAGVGIGAAFLAGELSVFIGLPNVDWPLPRPLPVAPKMLWGSAGFGRVVEAPNEKAGVPVLADSSRVWLDAAALPNTVGADDCVTGTPKSPVVADDVLGVDAPKRPWVEGAVDWVDPNKPGVDEVPAEVVAPNNPVVLGAVVAGVAVGTGAPKRPPRVGLDSVAGDAPNSPPAGVDSPKILVVVGAVSVGFDAPKILVEAEGAVVGAVADGALVAEVVVSVRARQYGQPTQDCSAQALDRFIWRDCPCRTAGACREHESGYKSRYTSPGPRLLPAAIHHFWSRRHVEQG